MKKAYVVHDPGSTYGCANAAAKALTERGLIVTSGYMQNKPADAITDVAEIVETLARELRSGDVVAIMSNGAFGGIHEKLLAVL